jgi:hypothetical protein
VLHDFAADLQHQIDKRLANLKEDLAGGCAKDHADYRRICGAFGELKAFRKVIHDRLIHFLNDEDEDD